MKLVQLLILLSLIFLSIEKKTHKNHHKSHLSKTHRNHINEDFKIKIFIYGEQGFDLEDNTIVSFTLKDLKFPEGEKKNSLFVTLEQGHKFTVDKIFKLVSGNIYSLPYQYLSNIKTFYDTDKLKYFYMSTTNPQYYNIAFQFSQRADYDDTISIIDDIDFNTLISLFSKNIQDRVSQVTKLKEQFITAANTYFTNKQKSIAANKGLSAIEAQIEKIIQNIAEEENEKKFIEGSESVILSVIETLEKQLVLLRIQQKKSNVNIIQKNDIIKQQSAALVSLKSGTTSASQYEKEAEEAKKKFLTTSENYKIELDKDLERSIADACNELLLHNNLEKFQELIEKIL